MQKPRIPPHPTTKQEILFLRRMGFPAQKKMKLLSLTLMRMLTSLSSQKAKSNSIS